MDVRGIGLMGGRTDRSDFRPIRQSLRLYLSFVVRAACITY